MARIVVVGANRGIGLELARQWHERGETVFAVCRNSSAELDTMGVEVLTGVDIRSDDSVRLLGEKLGGEPIDVLAITAGILRHESLGALDYESIGEQFEVNAVGPLRVVAALRKQLGAGSKVAVLTSRMGSIADNSSGSYYGYRMSKAALNAAAVSLARDLGGSGVAVAILHPGYVQTGMTGYSGDATAAESAARLIARVDELSMDNTGTFWHANGEILPW